MYFLFEGSMKKIKLDDTCLLLNIPADLLGLIFKKCGWREWKKLRLTCKCIDSIVRERVIDTYYEESCKVTQTATESSDRAALLEKFKSLRHIHFMGLSEVEVVAVSSVARTLETLKIHESSLERLPSFAVEFLSKCESLTQLSLNMAGGFVLESEVLRGFPKLEALSLRKVQFEEDHVELLSSLNLKCLKLYDLKVPKPMISRMVSREATQLYVEIDTPGGFSLFGGGTRFRVEEMEEILKEFPKLQKVEFGYPWAAEGFEILAKYSKDIESVNLANLSFGVSRSDIICKAFPQWPNLRKLKVGYLNQELSKEALEVLKTYSVKLDWLSVTFAEIFCDSRLFEALPNLRHVRISFSKNMDSKGLIEKSCRYWQQVRTLTVELYRNEFSFETLCLIGETCKNLSRLVIYGFQGNPISEEELIKFKTQHKAIKVWI